MAKLYEVTTLKTNWADIRRQRRHDPGDPTNDQNIKQIILNTIKKEGYRCISVDEKSITKNNICENTDPNAVLHHLDETFAVEHFAKDGYFFTALFDEDMGLYGMVVYYDDTAHYYTFSLY